MPIRLERLAEFDDLKNGIVSPRLQESDYAFFFSKNAEALQLTVKTAEVAITQLDRSTQDGKTPLEALLAYSENLGNAVERMNEQMDATRTESPAQKSDTLFLFTSLTTLLSLSVVDDFWDGTEDDEARDVLDVMLDGNARKVMSIITQLENYGTKTGIDLKSDAFGAPHVN